MERNIDMLYGVEHQSSPTLATLHGFKTAFIEGLGLKKFPLVMHDNHKKAVQSAYGSNSYPYGYFYITSLGLDSESFPVQQIRRHGDGKVSIRDFEAALVEKSFMFPSKMQLQAVYLTDDLLEAISFIERLSIINQTRLLSFDIQIDSLQSSWNVNVVSDSPELSIPQVTEDDEAKANVFEIQFGYTVSSKIGHSRSAPKINNSGHITTNVNVGGSSE